MVSLRSVPKVSSLVLFLACTIFLCPAQSVISGDANIPRLEKRGIATQMIVDGKPFLILGGELHNSSSSSADYMKDIWPRLTAAHYNTVLVPVAWETIEPKEGQFEFRNVDELLEGARSHQLHLVILWFGTWKNTFSSYVPAWVKEDEFRFPRVQMRDGRGTERISPLSPEAQRADSKAFARLMRHLRESDTTHTVLMVQVENEVGVIPQSRDFSPVADHAFHTAVPAALMAYLQAHRTTLNAELRSAWEAAGAKTSGTWQEVFGDTLLTNDLFMAWQYAKYIESVAASGKREYPLPMYTNAALIRPNYQPGQYNSGGPLPHSIDLWKIAAPSLDLLSPDIYFNEFGYWASSYARPDNPLFIPETQPGNPGAANALYAFGKLSAIGFSPFGVDNPSDTAIDLVGITHTNERGDTNAIGAMYAELEHLAPLITDAQSKGKITAAVVEGEAQRAGRVDIGDYTATITRAGSPPQSRIGVMFLQLSPNEFLVAGSGDAQVTFTSEKPGLPIVGIESIDEEFFRNGEWTRGRRLNGDENSQGQSLRIQAVDAEQGRIYRLRLYRYR